MSSLLKGGLETLEVENVSILWQVFQLRQGYYLLGEYEDYSCPCLPRAFLHMPLVPVTIALSCAEMPQHNKLKLSF